MNAAPSPDPVLRALHLTDIHLALAWDVPERFRAALREIRRRHPETTLMLNTGDMLGGHPEPAYNQRRRRAWQEIVGEELSGIRLRNIVGNHEFDWLPEDRDVPGGLNDLLAALDMPERFHETDPGYGLVEFYADGRVDYTFRSLRGIVTNEELESVPHLPQDWSYLEEEPYP